MSGSHLALMVWLSPAFPVGAFAYSHGLEWAHEAGDLTDAASLEDWLGRLLALSPARNENLPLESAPLRPRNRGGLPGLGQRGPRNARRDRRARAGAGDLPGAPARDDDARRCLRRRDPSQL